MPSRRSESECSTNIKLLHPIMTKIASFNFAVFRCVSEWVLRVGILILSRCKCCLQKTHNFSISVSLNHRYILKPREDRNHLWQPILLKYARRLLRLVITLTSIFDKYSAPIFSFIHERRRFVYGSQCNYTSVISSLQIIFFSFGY